MLASLNGQVGDVDDFFPCILTEKSYLEAPPAAGGAGVNRMYCSISLRGYSDCVSVEAARACG
jgi:hypothetical protein